MSRNASGTYSLPAGNPVTTATTISSTVHNSTLSDIATELTDSLSRSNKGPMLDQLQIVAGTAGSPGLAFGTDTNSGVYSIGADNIGIALNGTKYVDIGTGSTAFTAAVKLQDGSVSVPALTFTSDTNSGLYRIGADNIGVALNGTKHLDLSTTAVDVASKKITSLTAGTAATDAVAFSQITPASVSPVAGSDWTIDGALAWFRNMSGMVFGYAIATLGAGSGAWTSILTMPSGSRPPIAATFLGHVYDSSATKYYGAIFNVATTGVLSMTYYDNGAEMVTPFAIGGNDVIRVSFCYPAS